MVAWDNDKIRKKKKHGQRSYTGSRIYFHGLEVAYLCGAIASSVESLLSQPPGHWLSGRVVVELEESEQGVGGRFNHVEVGGVIIPVGAI